MKNAVHLFKVYKGLLVAAGLLLGLVVVYAALKQSTNMQSKAGRECAQWEPRKRHIAEKTILVKGGWQTTPAHDEVYYTCRNWIEPKQTPKPTKPATLQEGSGGNNDKKAKQKTLQKK